MKERHKIKIANDNLLRNGRQMRTGIILYAFLIVLLIVTLLLNGSTGHFYNRTSKVFQKELSDIGYVQYESGTISDGEKQREYIERINQIECIENVGYWEISGIWLEQFAPAIKKQYSENSRNTGRT